MENGQTMQEQTTAPMEAEPRVIPQTGFAKTRKASERQPFSAEKKDALFVIFAYLIGFLFVRWNVIMGGWGVTVFTWLYAAGVLVYARKKNIAPARESWYTLNMRGRAFSSFAASPPSIWG